MTSAFWQTLADLPQEHRLVIDRPRGQAHPRFPELIYPLDYGYLEGTASADGGGIDVWLGSCGTRELTGILCTFDTWKQDAEIKLLLGCTAADIGTILDFHSGPMRFLYIPKPGEEPPPFDPDDAN